ncbi:Pycsar system effector family protein [Streptomyces thermodiastaticus]|uniref:Pycsar system effector family protein n=1 Tax=Streptomyces thermodiastaticus TaxID=44061 RepID=UPI0019A438DC|nr:Pycsar system effector family protein [Streptomyces thermodiastaticus]MCE7550053.1 DUF5706 domain-containing protein [Streptomyces thermodiastaticus]GHF66997.1 hypothetical protein GCM10018787_14210 [Streptomyces thermodiastaticus]
MTTTAPAAPPAGLPVRASARAQLCERLLSDLRAETARADSKASVLVAALGMTAGVFSAVLANRGWTPARLSTRGTLLWWTGIASYAASLFALLLAVVPRYRRTWAPGQPVSSFADIRQAVRASRLDAAIDDTARDPTAALIAGLCETSRIATRKHQWIRTGLIAFCVGTVLVPTSLLIE